MDSMLPKYMLRTIGCDAPYGTTYSINPAMIIVLVPIVSLVTSHVPHFDMVHYGSFVSASSPFWIYLVPSPPVVGPVLFVVQLSLGEAVWSPRWCADLRLQHVHVTTCQSQSDVNIVSCAAQSMQSIKMLLCS